MSVVPVVRMSRDVSWDWRVLVVGVMPVVGVNGLENGLFQVR